MQQPAGSPTKAAPSAGDQPPAGSGPPPPWAGPPTSWPGQLLPPPPTPPLAAKPARPPRDPDPAPRRLLVLAIAGAVAFDLGLRGGVANAATAGGLAIAALTLSSDGRLRNRQARLLARLSLLPTLLLAVRMSPWLATANVSASIGLLVVAIGVSTQGSVLDLRLRSLADRLGGAATRGWSSPRLLASIVPRPAPRHGVRAKAIGRAALIAAPALGVIVLLLASADPVFAGLLTPDLRLGSVFGHLALMALATLGIVALAGSAGAVPGAEAPPGRFGSIEVATMLGLAVAVLGLFSLAQVIATTGAGGRLVASSGLTPAEYARSGFFQLCWATVVLVGFLAIVRSLAGPDVFATRSVRALAALVPVLAIGLVAVALRRMALYDAAFGLTMLRLFVVGVTIWLGAVLIFMAARNLGLGSNRDWLLAAGAGAAVVLLGVANIANPEAAVVRHNVARADQGAEVDISYLATLSDDAAPALVEALEATTDPHLRDALLLALDCDRDERGAARLNVAVTWADDARARACQPAAA